MTPEKNLDPKHAIGSNQELLAAEHPQEELLIWNHRLGHLPFGKIKILAVLAIIPNRISNVKAHKFKRFIYGAMTKRSWRTKGIQANTIQTITEPVKCILVDQLETPLPGFLAQPKVRLTNQKYIYTTVCFEHFIRLIYAHLQRNLTSEDTSKSNQAFDGNSRKQGVIIRNYHADNGRFTNNAFINSMNA